MSKSTAVMEHATTHITTGRPKRKSAGHKPVDPSYVNPNDFIDDESDVEHQKKPFSFDSDSASDDDLPPRKKSKKNPRKSLKVRAPSLSPPPLSPVASDMEDLDSETDSEPLTPTDGGVIELTVNIEAGFKGPLVIRIDQSGAIAHGSQGSRSRNDSPLDARRSPTPPVSKSTKGKIGFLDLAPEIRNKVYTLLCVKEDDIRFWEPRNFQSSASFLRTCKQIRHEGASVLYGSNTFCFDRNRDARQQYWESTRKEIGYKDMRRWFTHIGPLNLGFLRRLSIAFEDANPSSSRDNTNEGRRFVNDEQLLQCLRLLARHAKLQYFQASFMGRKKLAKSDEHFLDVISRIKTDELHLDPHRKWPYHHNWCKVEMSVSSWLNKKMVRDPKLYPVPQKPALSAKKTPPHQKKVTWMQ